MEKKISQKVIVVVAPMYVVELTGVESVTQLERGGQITLHYRDGSKESARDTGKKLAGPDAATPGDFGSMLDVVGYVHAQRPHTVIA